MSVFADMLSDAFEALGDPATYRLPGGTPAAITVIPASNDFITPYGETRVFSSHKLFEVRTAELPAPVQGGIIAHAGFEYVIKDKPRTDDPERLIWTIECVPRDIQRYADDAETEPMFVDDDETDPALTEDP